MRFFQTQVIISVAVCIIIYAQNIAPRDLMLFEHLIPVDLRVIRRSPCETNQTSECVANFHFDSPPNKEIDLRGTCAEAKLNQPNRI